MRLTRTHISFCVATMFLVASIAAYTGSASLAANSEASAPGMSAAGAGTWRVEFRAPLYATDAVAVMQRAGARTTFLAFQQAGVGITWAGEVSVSDSPSPTQAAAAFAARRASTYIKVRVGNSSTGKAKQAPTLTSCQAGGARCDTFEMYHVDQCSYDYGIPSTFWPIRSLPISSWHWNRNSGSENGLQPGCA